MTSIRQRKAEETTVGKNEEIKMAELKFTDVYLRGNFNPCPCGYVFDLDELEALLDHFIKGHFLTEKKSLKNS